MSLCKSLSVLLGGDIKVKSTLGKGTSFTFWIENHQIFDPTFEFANVQICLNII